MARTTAGARVMAVGCQVVPADGAFAQGVIGFLDCQARTLGSQGYAALAAPGATAAVLLGILLTLMVGLFGVRLLLGHVPDIREGVVAFVKIGFVLALATNWPAYQTLVYDLALGGPAELVAQVGGGSALPGATGGLVARLDGVDQQFRALAIVGPGIVTPVADANGAIERYPPPLFNGFDSFAIGAARAIFLAGAIAAFAVVRLGAGLLLALGPLFIAFLLFEATSGLFLGWARALVAMLLGATATAVALGVELALVEPWLAELLARRAADYALPGVAAQLLAITLVFAVVLGGLLRLATRVAFSLSRVPERVRDLSPGQAIGTTGDRAALATTNQRVVALNDPRSRASAIADAVLTSERRETSLGVAETRDDAIQSSRASKASAASARRDQVVANQTPLGRSYRRASTRSSASVRKRDRRP